MKSLRYDIVGKICDKVRRQVRKQVRAQVDEQVWYKVWNETHVQVCNHIWDKVNEES